jgi:hypothetical protein
MLEASQDVVFEVVRQVIAQADSGVDGGAHVWGRCEPGTKSRSGRRPAVGAETLAAVILGPATRADTMFAWCWPPSFWAVPDWRDLLPIGR